MSRYNITVSGQRYKFNAEPIIGGGLIIHAPGVVPFTVDSLAEARNTLRSLYGQY